MHHRRSTLLRTILIATTLASLACAKAPATPVQMPESKRVLVGRSDPPDNYELVGPITAQDGRGCRLFGRRGNHDNAIIALQVEAATMGAEYVAITTITVPHQANQNCFANPYIISGMAYRRTAAAPSPVPVRNVNEPAPERDLVGKLRELHELHQAGALTDDEFERAKARLLE